MPSLRTFSTAVGLSMALGASAMASAPEIEIGKPFPELALPSMDSGKPMSIAAFRGKKVILQVFASW